MGQLVPVGRYEGTSWPAADGSESEPVTVYSKPNGTLRLEYGDGRERFAVVKVTDNGAESPGTWTHMTESGPCVFAVAHDSGNLTMIGENRYPGNKPPSTYAVAKNPRWEVRATFASRRLGGQQE